MWIRRCAYGIAVVLLLSGCSSYTSRAVLIKDALAQDDYEKSLEQIEETNPILAYEMNGSPLTVVHGAPLRSSSCCSRWREAS